MTRIPPLVGRLSRNERTLVEAKQRQEQWAHDQRRQGEHDKRAGLRRDIAAERAKPLSLDNVPLTPMERAKIRHWVRFAKP